MANINATGLRTALWRGDLGAELPLLAGCRRSQRANLIGFYNFVKGQPFCAITGRLFHPGGNSLRGLVANGWEGALYRKPLSTLFRKILF